METAIIQNNKTRKTTALVCCVHLINLAILRQILYHRDNMSLPYF